MEVFETCKKINSLISCGEDQLARDNLIVLLDHYKTSNLAYTPLLNNLIRQVGLYPYLDDRSSHWADRFIKESFKVNAGGADQVTLHREQSNLLRKLLDGESLAVSAPTSFGKRFVIDAFIATARPETVVIIVPTIALTDETRRRLQRKFSQNYKIVTTADVSTQGNTIFIFPQERALGYAHRLKTIDLLIVDEFYKASSIFDKQRSPSLLNAILKFGQIAKQRYFLAPNISSLKASPFTVGMEFLEIKFNTVFLEKHNLFNDIGKDKNKKALALKKIMADATSKTLIYAGSYGEIEKVAQLLLSDNTIKPLSMRSFSEWLAKNYEKDWSLTKLVQHGIGIHTGQLHRSISQIQVKLFEESDGLNTLISTSSIVEGVNTSAQNIVIWRNRNGSSKLGDFMYRNIIGRGGRMFKHFIGNIFILEEPPEALQTELELAFPESVMDGVDVRAFKSELTADQIARIIAYKREMGELLGEDIYAEAVRKNYFQSSDSSLLRDIARSMVQRPSDWNGFGYLNSDDPDDWGRMLYMIVKFQPAGWEGNHTNLVNFVKILSENWSKAIPQLLAKLNTSELGIETFFKLERAVTYKLAALVSDVNKLHQIVFINDSTDVSSFCSKLSNAFLPGSVLSLEEYGLPRMISRKICRGNVLPLEDNAISLHTIFDLFRNIGQIELVRRVRDLDEFDKYLISHFYDGIKIGETRDVRLSHS